MKATAPSPSTPALLDGQRGHVEFLIGNEAIVRGAIEAGVGFASGYPGTPSTEVTEGFARLAPALGIPFEYSVNEKIALETAFAASLCGARAIVAMKHLGLMSAGDPLSTIPYIGTRGGLVIVSAGDPSCLTSPNEQDQRHLADTLHLPTFDPRSPQDALIATRLAFELSELCNLPVLLRPTTRICHTRAEVEFGDIQERQAPRFQRDPGRNLPVPANARRLRLEIEQRLAAAKEFVSQGDLFDVIGKGRLGVLASGAPAGTCQEIMAENDLFGTLRLLSLGVVYPLPEAPLLDFLRGIDQLLVVEELSPYLEDRVRALIALHGLSTRVLGKRTGHLPVPGEYLPDIIRRGLEQAFDVSVPVTREHTMEALPGRPPILCAACPHRSAFFAIRAALDDDVLYFNDIGCYTLGIAPPLSTGDALLSMGSSLALAAGVARTTGARTVGFVGDSTFFHSGMPALLNAIKENVRMVAVILDNSVTAMTGFQESPSAKISQGRLERHVDIEGIVRALGAQHVECVDPAELASTVGAFARAAAFDGLSVVITQRPCPVFAEKAGVQERDGEPETFHIDPSRCRECGRQGCGHRCDQGISLEFERAMVRTRSIEAGTAADNPAVAPCAEACPLMLCVQGYASHIAAGDPGAAFELILEELALPGSVCRVCDRPCESVCSASHGHTSVAINDLKRYAVDWAAANNFEPAAPERDEASGKRVAIVGAGPAGLAAAAELWQRGHAVTLFDAADEAGGLLIAGIPEYRLPKQVVRRDVARLLGRGVAFEGGRRLGRDLELNDLLADFDGVLLAIGAGRSLELELATEAGVELPEVIGALDYLKSDASFTSNATGTTAVIGGGNSAVDAARTALRRGAQRVTMLSLESRAHMPAIDSELREAELEGIELLGGMRVVQLRAGGLVCEPVAATDPASQDPMDFVPTGGEERTITASRVILAVGQRPELEALGDLAHSLEWAGDWLRADRTLGSSSHPRLFAAGDLVGGTGTVTGAMASGRRAAWGLDRVLRGEAAADRRPPPPLPTRPRGAARSNPTPSSCGPVRQVPPTANTTRRTSDFTEVIGTLTEAQARAEAARCTSCGSCGNCNSCLDLFGCPAFLSDGAHVAIDPALCTGCGVCAQFCPNGAILPGPAPAGLEASR